MTIYDQSTGKGQRGETYGATGPSKPNVDAEKSYKHHYNLKTNFPCNSPTPNNACRTVHVNSWMHPDSLNKTDTHLRMYFRSNLAIPRKGCKVSTTHLTSRIRCLVPHEQRNDVASTRCGNNLVQPRRLEPAPPQEAPGGPRRPQEVPRASWGLLGPPGASWGFLGSPGASWGFLGPPGASWGLLGPPGASWGLLGPPGTSWGLLGPPGASWDLLGLPGASWGLMGPSGASWGLLGPPKASKPSPGLRKNTCSYRRASRDRLGLRNLAQDVESTHVHIGGLNMTGQGLETNARTMKVRMFM